MFISLPVLFIILWVVCSALDRPAPVCTHDDDDDEDY